ncbi:hypothetical protein [Streptomyces sp. NBC_00385]|nr:hypothetical protein [Streptomyces sp. NBC_00385]WRZ05916.1 hypothetical protein OG959_22530 [Streptomyces sp. NBC_00385]
MPSSPSGRPAGNGSSRPSRSAISDDSQVERGSVAGSAGSVREVVMAYS